MVLCTTTEAFYESLPSLSRFLDLANPDNYVAAPHDWYVLITDIVGSTQAIATGQYKEVNLLGASSIMAVLNAVSPVEVPFVFGGDGASLVVPPSVVGPAREALLGLRHLAQTAFGMELRVGVVPVSVVTAQYPLKVAKFKLTANYSQASFLGGGLSYATDLVKSDARYRLDVMPHIAADLSGLECRWQDVPSPYGHTLSLIVATAPNSSLDSQANIHLYQDVVRQIQRIYGDDKRYHPILKSALKLTFNPKKLSAEIKARARSPQFWHRAAYLLKILVENALGWAFMRLRLTLGGVHWGRYKDEVYAASDYQKIDDLLRMVISGTPAQTARLERYLERRFRAGQLTYGLHVSNRALMTCLILNRQKRHFHLIDGADGGYALAAKAMKARHKKSG